MTPAGVAAHAFLVNRELLEHRINQSSAVHFGYAALARGLLQRLEITCAHRFIRYLQVGSFRFAQVQVSFWRQHKSFLHPTSQSATSFYPKHCSNLTFRA